MLALRALMLRLDRRHVPNVPLVSTAPVELVPLLPVLMARLVQAPGLLRLAATHVLLAAHAKEVPRHSALLAHTRPLVKVTVPHVRQDPFASRVLGRLRYVQTEVTPQPALVAV